MDQFGPFSGDLTTQYILNTVQLNCFDSTFMNNLCFIDIFLQFLAFLLVKIFLINILLFQISAVFRFYLVYFSNSIWESVLVSLSGITHSITLHMNAV